MLKASTRRVARLKTFTHLESWVPACDCQCPPQAQAPPSVKQLPIPGFKGTKFQKCDCVWPIMILERFIFNKVNIGNCSLLAPSRRLLSGNASDDTWRLKSSYGWFLPVQTRSNQNVKIALHRRITHKSQKVFCTLEFSNSWIKKKHLPKHFGFQKYCPQWICFWWQGHCQDMFLSVFRYLVSLGGRTMTSISTWTMPQGCIFFPKNWFIKPYLKQRYLSQVWVKSCLSDKSE